MITSTGMTRPLVRLLNGRAIIFMFHRFPDREVRVNGHDVSLVREALAYLRKHRYDLVSLEEVFRRLARQGPALRRTVAFTIDDGYRDHATVAGPLFAEFDCPVTTFVTTGFLDGTLWFWWDQIEYVFRNTTQRTLAVDLGTGAWQGAWTESRQRARAEADFTLACKRLPDAEKLEAIGALAGAAEVDIPTEPPLECAPMSWEQLRGCETSGMTFGPHTVTHPVLSRTSDEQSRQELRGSWERLCERAAHPTPVFCYPNGRFDDFGSREISTLQQLGLMGAVIGAPGGYPDPGSFGANDQAPFMVRRTTFPATMAQFLQHVTGLDQLKRTLRGGGRA